jgi:hypothetical protein
MESLSEAKTSPYAASHSSFGGVTKQMRAGGLSSAPLDTIKFIREILFNLDVISHEELETVKNAKGFTGKKQAMLAVLRANQDAINAKTDEIAKSVESTLDDFIGGMGVNRSREEKYAAQAASQEMAAEIRKAKSGKEMDDALTDIVSDEKLLVKASLAKAIQELEDLPAGEDLSTEIVNNIKEFAPKIDTIDQFEALVKQMGEMEEYQIPAYHLSGTVKALKGGLEDIEMEDQEDPDVEDNEDAFAAQKAKVAAMFDQQILDEVNAKVQKYANEPDFDHDTEWTAAMESIYKKYKVMYKRGQEKGDRYEAAKRLFNKSNATQARNLGNVEDGEHGHGSVEEHYPEEKDPKQPLEPEDAEVSIEQEVHDACKERAGDKATNAELAQACQEMYEIYGEDGDEEKAEIAEDLRKSYHAKSKSENEELTIESAYSTMYIKAPVMDENGKTSQDCKTQQYLTEAVEQEIEEAGLYTEGYLVEQKTADSYIKSKPEQGQTFKERYKPKTSYQLEELRRYGL